jgi:hypothetical protein
VYVKDNKLFGLFVENQELKEALSFISDTLHSLEGGYGYILTQPPKNHSNTTIKRREEGDCINE